MKRLLIPITVLAGSISTLHAQSFFTSPSSQFLTPGWRDSVGEYSRWDVLYSPFGEINYPDMEAPNGEGQTASEAGFAAPANASPEDPFAFWHPQNPTLKQTGTSSAFIIGPGAAGNIYSFAAPTAYQIADTTPSTLGSVVMQFQTDGTLMDLDSIKLVAGGIEYAPTNFITEYKSSGSAMGGITNRSAAQWNLTGLGLSSYSITFNANGSSNSFQELLLDTTPTYSEAVPSARSWNSTTGNWSGSGNWTQGTLPPSGGNVTVASGNSLTVDGGTQTVGELKLNAPGVFTIGASGGGVLKINTGITAEPASSATYAINAPVTLGAYHLTYLNANTTLNFNAPIGGATGMYFYGPGKMRLNANNTFTGSLTLDGGTLEIGGTNAYTGSTTVYGGALVVKAGGAVLGNSAGAVSIGSGGTYGEPEAALLIGGPFTLARNVTLTAGADPKKLGGQDTGAGATFSGTVTLNSSTSNVRLHAANAGDKVTFTGTITGGASGGTLTKTGAGTVVFSGGIKNYLSDTIVSEGTLQIAQKVTLRSLNIGAGATVTLGATAPSGFAGFGESALADGLSASVSATIPEPGSVLLLGCGLFFFANRRQRLLQNCNAGRNEDKAREARREIA